MELRKHKFIVFGAEHYNPLGLLRSLGEEKIYPIAIIINDETKVRLASVSKYISKLHMVNSIDEGYKVLMKYYSGEKEYLPFLFTGEDSVQSYLDLHYNTLKEHFIMYNASEQGRISYYMNKNNINNLAIKHGFDVLENCVVNTGEIPENLEFPIMTKAIISTLNNWKGDVFICHNRDELIDAYKKIHSEKVLLQKYIEKKNELCLDGCSVNKGKDMFVSMASKYNYILPNTYSPYMTITNYDNKEVLSKCQKMLEEIKFEGIFTIEFLIDQNDELHFMEVNLRNSSWSYASTTAGMNLPLIWAKGMLEGHIKTAEVRKQIPSNFTAMVEQEDFRIRIKNKKISMINWIKDCFSCDCLFYFNKKDMKPVLSLVLDIVKRKLRHK